MSSTSAAGVRKVAVTLALSVLAAGNVAAATITCPNPLQSGQTNTYTTTGATDCVWGNKNIGNGSNDEFLDGLGINDPTYGNSGPRFGFTDWVMVSSSGSGVGSILGLNTSNATSTTFNWQLTNVGNYQNYALGLKDGADPKWAVFLLDGSISGSASMTGGSWSHIVLYGRNPGGGGGGGGGGSTPEPASLALVGLALAAAGSAVRRRRRA